MFDGTLRLVRANERFAELIAMSAADAIGRSICDSFPNALADLSEQIDDVASLTASADFVLRKPVRTQDLLDQIAGDV